MKIPPMGYVPIKEPTYFYIDPNAETLPTEKELQGQDLYYGEFYDKLVTTKNKIEQYNEMVYGSPSGVKDTAVKLQGLPN